jgi:hypothetical protein
MRMSGLISMLQTEEQRLLGELHGNPLLEKFDAISRLATLYAGGRSETVAPIELLLSRWEPDRPAAGPITGGLVSALQVELWELLAELRTLPAVDRLRAVRRVIALYSGQPANEQSPPGEPLPGEPRHDPRLMERAPERAADHAALATVHRDPPSRAVSTVRAALLAVTGARDTALAS